jgi:NTE family protein
MINTLCFSSGSIYGFSFIGALKYLVDEEFINLDNIKILVGTSVGSIVAFLLAIEYTIDEIINFINNNDFTEIEPISDIENIFINYGLDYGTNIMNVIIRLLNDKLDIIDITFNELYNKTNKKLIIIGTNYTTGKEKIFSYENTPNMSIVTVIRISISIPFIFTPVLFENEYYIDGAITNSFALNLCDEKTTLGFNIINKNNYKLESIIDLIKNTLSILISKSTIDYNNYQIVNIKIELDINNFDMCNKHIQTLLNNGKYYAKEYLIFYYKNKIKKINNDIVKDTLNDIILKIEK